MDITFEDGRKSTLDLDHRHPRRRRRAGAGTQGGVTRSAQHVRRNCQFAFALVVSGAVDRADVLADRAGLRAGLQGDRRHQLRPGRVRHAGGLRRRGGAGGQGHAGARRDRASRVAVMVGVQLRAWSGSCCGRCSAGRSSPSSWRPSASAPCCAACRRSRSAARRARLPLPIGDEPIVIGPVIAAADPGPGRGRDAACSSAPSPGSS